MSTKVLELPKPFQKKGLNSTQGKEALVILFWRLYLFPQKLILL